MVDPYISRKRSAHSASPESVLFAMKYLSGYRAAVVRAAFKVYWGTSPSAWVQLPSEEKRTYRNMEFGRRDDGQLYSQHADDEGKETTEEEGEDA